MKTKQLQEKKERNEPVLSDTCQAAAPGDLLSAPTSWRPRDMHQILNSRPSHCQLGMQSSLGRVSRPAVSSRTTTVSCRASTVKSVALPVKSIDGSDKGTEELTLKVAEDTARGLVHRYLVMVQQNARRVSALLLKRIIEANGRRWAAMQTLSLPGGSLLVRSLSR